MTHNYLFHVNHDIHVKLQDVCEHI